MKKLLFLICCIVSIGVFAACSLEGKISESSVADSGEQTASVTGSESVSESSSSEGTDEKPEDSASASDSESGNGAVDDDGWLNKYY